MSETCEWFLYLQGTRRYVFSTFGTGCYQSNSQTNPTGPSEGESRVLRGGGWCYFDMGVRVSRRDYLTPGYRHIIIGLRLAL